MLVSEKWQKWQPSTLHGNSKADVIASASCSELKCGLVSPSRRLGIPEVLRGAVNERPVRWDGARHDGQFPLRGAHSRSNNRHKSYHLSNEQRELHEDNNRRNDCRPPIPRFGLASQKNEP